VLSDGGGGGEGLDGEKALSSVSHSVLSGTIHDIQLHKQNRVLSSRSRHRH
jgi:hypothetical protein